MPRAPKAIKNPVGCPPKEIDWNIVDEYLIAGCPGTKIAAAIGICNDTLYDRCEKEKGVNFSAYSQQKRSKGDALLHKSQFDYAIEGDTSLLIFLGKTRLDQRESQEVSVAPETVNAFAAMMAQLDQLQGKKNEEVDRKSPIDEMQESQVQEDLL